MSNAAAALVPSDASRVRSWFRRLITISVAALPVVLAGCSGGADATAPAPAAITLATAASPRSLAQAFVEAQGTYCDVGTPGDCAGMQDYGIGYYVAWCDDGCPAYIGADFGGVNARWWAGRTGVPSLPAYSYTGSVSETRLADGRRRIIANIHGHNTFVELFSYTDRVTVIMGASFQEYPTVSLPALARTPVLGDASLAAELIVPADFQGMPDVSQMIFFPVQGMEVRRLNVTITATGPLREAYEGIAAGTEVTASGVFRWLPKLAGTGVKSRRLIESGYYPASRLTIKPAPRAK